MWREEEMLQQMLVGVHLSDRNADIEVFNEGFFEMRGPAVLLQRQEGPARARERRPVHAPHQRTKSAVFQKNDRQVL